MNDTIIERVFIRNLVTTALVAAALVGIFFLVRWAVKAKTFPKWSYAVWLAVFVIVVGILSIGLLRIRLDIKNEDYVTYQGEYIERGGGQADLKTVVVYDEFGKEIRLLRTGAGKEGTYEGTVVYGSRSKIIVEYSGQPE